MLKLTFVANSSDWHFYKINYQRISDFSSLLVDAILCGVIAPYASPPPPRMEQGGGGFNLSLAHHPPSPTGFFAIGPDRRRRRRGPLHPPLLSLS